MSEVFMGSGSFLEHAQFLFPRIFMAIICGGIIGVEREMKNKPAGIKTNILICLGSCVYTAVSIMLSSVGAPEGHWGDPARVAAQIVSGIGFLGAGVIIQARGTIVGLTTAATIWVVASVGVVIGLGYWDVAIIVSFMTVFILVGASFFEDRMLGRSVSFVTEMVVDDPDGGVRKDLHALLSQHDLVLESFDIVTHENNTTGIQMRYSGHRRDQKNFVLSLWGAKGVKEIKSL